MAKSKISNTLPSSNKELNRQLVTGQIAAPQLVTAAPSSITPEQRDALLEISSAKWDDCPMSRDECPDEDANFIGNHFAWSSSQINTDLALAAQCELAGDIYLEDEDFFDLFRSPMYWNLRQTFMADAMDSDSGSLLKVVWRAYKAGLASPNRLVPDTKQVRIDRALKKR